MFGGYMVKPFDTFTLDELIEALTDFRVTHPEAAGKCVVFEQDYRWYGIRDDSHGLQFEKNAERDSPGDLVVIGLNAYRY